MCKYCNCINCFKPYDENPSYDDTWSTNEKYYTLNNGTWFCSEKCLDKWCNKNLNKEACHTCKKTIYYNCMHERAVTEYALIHKLPLVWSNSYIINIGLIYFCDAECERVYTHSEKIFYCTISRCGKKFCAKEFPMKGVCPDEDCQRSLTKALNKRKKLRMKRQIAYEKVMRANKVPEAAVHLIRAYLS